MNPLRHLLTQMPPPLTAQSVARGGFGRLRRIRTALQILSARDLSQPFKGNCSQIRSSVTGGAYNSVCRVTMCVRRDLSIGACLNCTRSTHQTVTKRPFSPHSFPARRKRMGRRRRVGNGLDGTSRRYVRRLLSSEPVSFPERKRFAGLCFGFQRCSSLS